MSQPNKDSESINYRDGIVHGFVLALVLALVGFLVGYTVYNLAIMNYILYNAVNTSVVTGKVVTGNLSMSGFMPYMFALFGAVLGFALGFMREVIE